MNFENLGNMQYLLYGIGGFIPEQNEAKAIGSKYATILNCYEVLLRNAYLKVKLIET